MKNALVQRKSEQLKEKLSQRGFELRLVQDEQCLGQMFNDIGKTETHPVSELHLDQLKRGEGFWLAMQHEGEFVTCISARVEHLHDRSFGEFWTNHCQSKYPERTHLVDQVSDQLNTTLDGCLVYFGGVQVAEGWQGNIARLKLFCDFARCVAYDRWAFDWLYTIINRKHRALSRIYGFEEIFDDAVSWVDPVPEGLSNDQVYLASRRQMVEARLFANPGELGDNRCHG
ncbi:hypothetical protein GG681_02585 [Epibacterium sp. SM1969]|uniref:N-acetyltransferase domain-containing protein n=1 Tax=Tritonibacter aquimaris TaxID=2663379 RepID=A0A844ASZ7_9RHOB|nr:hypothetical protein [Tritonibacter aquimaris]MQY41514.1 hypothetical protein [Tritonibacter aquimaris]